MRLRLRRNVEWWFDDGLAETSESGIDLTLQVEFKCSEYQTHNTTFKAFSEILRGDEKRRSSNTKIEACGRLIDPERPNQGGAKELRVWNCNPDERPVHVWLQDMTAGPLTELGTLNSQYDASGTCPGRGAIPMIVPLSSATFYRLIAVDPELIGCGGVNDPNKGACQRYLSGVIQGDSNGGTLISSSADDQPSASTETNRPPARKPHGPLTSHLFLSETLPP